MTCHCENIDSIFHRKMTPWQNGQHVVKLRYCHPRLFHKNQGRLAGGDQPSYNLIRPHGILYKCLQIPAFQVKMNRGHDSPYFNSLILFCYSIELVYLDGYSLKRGQIYPHPTIFLSRNNHNDNINHIHNQDFPKWQIRYIEMNKKYMFQGNSGQITIV